MPRAAAGQPLSGDAHKNCYTAPVRHGGPGPSGNTREGVRRAVHYNTVLELALAQIEYSRLYPGTGDGVIPTKQYGAWRGCELALNRAT